MTASSDPLGRDGTCMYCGAQHKTVCARVARLEINGEGDVTAVELHQPMSFTVESTDGETDVLLSGSYEDVKRYERERKMQ